MRAGGGGYGIEERALDRLLDGGGRTSLCAGE